MSFNFLLEKVFGTGKDGTSSSSSFVIPPSPANSIAASPNWVVNVKNDSRRLQSHGGAGIMIGEGSGDGDDGSSSSGNSSTTGHGSGGGFTPFIAFCFTINYIVGTGFLTIPWAFVQGGLVLSTILLLLVGVFADVSKNYLLETMSRAEVMLDKRMHWIKRSRYNADNDDENSNGSDENLNNTGGFRKNLPSLVYSPVMYNTGGGASSTETDTLLVKNTPGSSSLNEMGTLLVKNKPSSSGTNSYIPYTYQSLTTPSGSGGGNTSYSYPNAYELSLPPTPEASRPSTPTPSRPSSPPPSLPATPDRLHVLQGGGDSAVSLDDAGSESGNSRHGRRVMLVQKLRQHRQEVMHPTSTNHYMIKDRKFEVNTLCRVFLGKNGLNMFTIIICLYIYCTLWAYTSVFASAMSKKVPLLNKSTTTTTTGSSSSSDSFLSYLVSLIDDYTCYSIVFAMVVVPLSCMELDEQIAVQVAMTGCRFIMLALMLSTSSLCAQDTESLNVVQELYHQEHGIAMAEEEHHDGTYELFQISGLHKMLPIVVFALIFHHSIPGLAHPVNDKTQLRPIFSYALVFSTVAYSLLGLTLGMAFGNNIEQSSNLNWNHFRGGTGTFTTYVDNTSSNNSNGQLVFEFHHVAWWAKAISLYIVCFPALDVLSAYPLNAITLGNNMMGAFYGRDIHKVEVRALRD